MQPQAVEAGHREPFVEPERPLLAAVGPHQQAVVNEVEVDLEADLGTFHQWLRGAVVASSTLPTICTHR